MSATARSSLVLLPFSLLVLPEGHRPIVAAPPLRAQEVIELPKRDISIDASVLGDAFRIGGARARGWDVLGYVPTVAFDERGLLYVLDADESVVHVVDSEGELVRRLGRQGEGPGEFGSTRDMVVSRDGTLVIGDAQRRVYHAFSAAGDFVDQFRLGNAGGLSREMRGAVSGQSFLTLAETQTARRFEIVDLVGGTAVHRPLFSTWRPRDKVHPDGVEFMFSGYETSGPFEWWYPEAHFERLPGGGIAVADTSSWLIRIVGSDGSVDRLIRRPLSPHAITRTMRDEAKRRQRDWFDGLSPSRYRDLIFDAIDNMRFFPEVPVVCGMRTTWNGGIWIQRCDDDAFGDASAIDVIGPEGSYFGTFSPGATEMPDAFGPNGLIAFIQKDEFEATVVVVARLSDPALH